MMKQLTALLLLLLLMPMLAHAEMNFITLKHRNAEALIPLLQPVLSEDIRISGRNNLLIVNSKPRQLEEVRSLIEQLDTPLQSLMISVIQGGDYKQATLHGDIRGSIERPKVRIYGTKKKEKDAIAQRLRVIENEWATIRSGESIPVVTKRSSHSAHGTSVQQSIEYRDVESGFEVRPRIRGEHVTLEVRPFSSKRSTSGAGIIEKHNITTTVNGKLGEWITIGGIDEQQQHSGVGTFYATGKKHSATHTVKLKVERLNN